MLPARSTEPPRQDGSGSLDSDHVQTDGHSNQSPGQPRFHREANADKNVPSSPLRLQMPFLTTGQLAFSALQFLPVPVLVLNHLKTVVLANEAMGRLLGIVSDSDETTNGDGASEPLERLKGQSLSQVGIDMSQNGKPVWVAWETYLDFLADEMGSGHTNGTKQDAEQGEEGNITPATEASGDNKSPNRNQQAAVEVIISRRGSDRSVIEPRLINKSAENQAFAKMIISVWEVAGNQTYFTLTFTNTESTSSVSSKKKAVARSSTLDAAERKIISASSGKPPSVASSHGSSSSPSYQLSPSSISLSSNPFPPMGPPFNRSFQSTPSMLQKSTIMKDALLDNTEQPILIMWKDGTLAFPNLAARKLMEADASLDKPFEGLDLLRNWVLYSEDFSRRLDPSEYPMGILLRTQKPFSGMRFGLILQNGRRIVYNALSEAIRDDETGEFLAGVITCQDVTDMAKEIDQIKERNAESFKLICDTMPQLVWTATPDGYYDSFNTRWYDYTGLTPEESMGLGWKKPIHPDDVAETAKRWAHSIRTGEPYATEYRCQSKEGNWRWYLGRALPLRNPDGSIEKWFGTCTDVHEGIETRLAARRMRQQLLSVITHAHITIFTVDLDRRLTMLEGALIWDTAASGPDSPRPKWYIGGLVDEVFQRIHPQASESDRPAFESATEAIFARRSGNVVIEHEIDGRFYSTRLLPMTGRRVPGDDIGDSEIEGAIGVIMDMTELKAKEAVLQAQAREKQQLLAREAAAKEASRLKSQFLANMSHEIRTPITGVIGMAELLLDVELNEEQRDYAENIFRSANALLTVINDILDFSKVECGRLEVEEVQFCMSIIIKDVVKMMGFAAQRKSLEFISDIAPEVADDLVVLGDPGRIRQIITNLLTNSIKFTHQGFVKLSVAKEGETENTMQLRFSVQDTGIGIEEEVHKRLFQPFSQGDASTARKFGGTGLGLTICKSLLELMHGRIQLDSVVNQGTTASFWVTFNKPHDTQPSNLVNIQSLPDRLQSEMSVSCNSSEFDALGNPLPGELLGKPPWRKIGHTPSASQDDLAASERSKIHILVVEDNAINQQIATKTIRKLGFNVSAVWNGKEALQYLIDAQQGQNHKPDIILMDVQMPVIDGYKATHLLRHHAPYRAYVRDVPIVAMTASAIQGDQEKCKRAGMDDYMAKPVKSKLLEGMLVRWSLNRRSAPTPRPSSEASECSHESDHCTYTGVPFVGLEEDDNGPSSIPGLVPAERLEPGDSRSTTLPQRPKAPPEGKSPLPAAGRPKSQSLNKGSSGPQVRRLESDELAQQGRDDKLIDAAGQPPPGVPMLHTPMSEKGDSLTEENVQKFIREEELRRRRMS
ncbi:Two-component system protein A [Cytospora mali]|uniref:Two-component system protein A n=1 Tax=Cytospora mali TaxID=578113 RepID=A0A194W0Z4_CYTMA|nr:Two-component system protein A [Valsa mali]